MLEIIQFPDPNTFIAHIASTSQPWFSELLPWIYWPVGVFVAAGLVVLIFTGIITAFIWLLDEIKYRREIDAADYEIKRSRDIRSRL